MNGSDLYVSTAVGATLKPGHLIMAVENPPKISIAEAERIIQRQQRLVIDGARANMKEVGLRAVGNCQFKTVQRNSLAVGFLVDALYLQQRAENADQLEAALLDYGRQRTLDSRDLLHEESLWSEGYGTCFLTGDKEVVTAAHVFCNDSNAGTSLQAGTLRVVFGYEAASGGQIARVFRKHYQVFEVKPQTVVCPARGTSFSLADDWMKLTLVESATVDDRTPLVVSPDPPTINTPVYTLGYPNGVSLRYVHTAIQLETQADGFSAFLDAYGMSSGSPVFSADDHKVVGLIKKSFQAGGLCFVTDRKNHVSQICLPDFGAKATLCVSSAAFGP